MRATFIGRAMSFQAGRMLILCYGMPKSGSTLAFELVRGVLQNAGHPQETFINEERDPDALAKAGPGKRNFARALTREKIEGMVAKIGPDQKIAVKTHSRMPTGGFSWLEDLYESGDLRVVASYRDPREMCLSLLDAATKAEKSGFKAFAERTDLRTAAKGIERRIPHFREWGALKGTLRLDYDTAAFLPDNAIDEIERSLLVTCDREAAKNYTFNSAYTQKNKAKRGRYRELDEEQNAELLERFDEFIRRVCDMNDQGWFEERRAGLVAASKLAGAA
jgi:hypothetical protein